MNRESAWIPEEHTSQLGEGSDTFENSEVSDYAQTTSQASHIDFDSSHPMNGRQAPFSPQAGTFGVGETQEYDKEGRKSAISSFLDSLNSAQGININHNDLFGILSPERPSASSHSSSQQSFSVFRNAFSETRNEPQPHQEAGSVAAWMADPMEATEDFDDGEEGSDEESGKCMFRSLHQRYFLHQNLRCQFLYSASVEIAFLYFESCSFGSSPSSCRLHLRNAPSTSSTREKTMSSAQPV